MLPTSTMLLFTVPVFHGFMQTVFAITVINLRKGVEWKKKMKRKGPARQLKRQADGGFVYQPVKYKAYIHKKIADTDPCSSHIQLPTARFQQRWNNQSLKTNNHISASYSFYLHHPFF